jgi:hypothetical protein
MLIDTLWRDGDYGIYVRIEADDGRMMDFYFPLRTGKVIGPEEGFTPEQFQFALEASKRPGIEEPGLFLADVPPPAVH